MTILAGFRVGWINVLLLWHGIVWVVVIAAEIDEIRAAAPQRAPSLERVGAGCHPPRDHAHLEVGKFRIKSLANWILIAFNIVVSYPSYDVNLTDIARVQSWLQKIITALLSIENNFFGLHATARPSQLKKPFFSSGLPPLTPSSPLFLSPVFLVFFFYPPFLLFLPFLFQR